MDVVDTSTMSTAIFCSLLATRMIHPNNAAKPSTVQCLATGVDEDPSTVLKPCMARTLKF